MNTFAIAGGLAMVGMVVAACGGGGGGNPAPRTVQQAVAKVAAADTVPEMNAALADLVETAGLSEPLSPNMPGRPFKQSFLDVMTLDQLHADNGPNRSTLKDWYDAFSAQNPTQFPAGGFDALVARILAKAPGAKQRTAAGVGSRHDRAITALLAMMDLGNGVDSRDPTITEFNRLKQTITTVVTFVDTVTSETVDGNCTTVCSIESSRQTTTIKAIYEHCRRIEGIYGWGEACYDLPEQTISEQEVTTTTETCTTTCHEQ